MKVPKPHSRFSIWITVGSCLPSDDGILLGFCTLVNVLAFWKEVLPPSSVTYLKGRGSEMEEIFCQLYRI